MLLNVFQRVTFHMCILHGSIRCIRKYAALYIGIQVPDLAKTYIDRYIASTKRLVRLKQIRSMLQIAYAFKIQAAGSSL